jgi:hypothetical protein
MPRPPRTFVGALYSDAWVFSASTKAEAGRVLFDLIPARWQSETSPGALARYVGPLCWCPKRKRLWFKMTITKLPRQIHPSYVPEGLWAGIQTAEAEHALETIGSYGHGKGSAEVSAKALRDRASRTAPTARG